MNTKEYPKIAIIGLGYVGLPLAVEFGKKFQTTGFDINSTRVYELSCGFDSTLEVESLLLSEARKLTFTTEINRIKDCNIFIVTVPTPINEEKLPDLSPLIMASRAIGKILKIGDIVIYESTVYPGATEEVCVPILEQQSSLKYNRQFFCGYSPERINPGDKKHRITSIKKVTSGSTPEIADKVDKLYKKIITAGTFKVASIKIAEAAKVIENTQRDINIALINELSVIFNKLNIDTEAVLEAAGTKWNFLPFKPGLVGGHCIGVDPYYLTYKALEAGYNPEMILAGRKVNDNMGEYVANQVIFLMGTKNINVFEANILILGLAFKENCSDIRNTRVVDVIAKLSSLNCNLEVYDPLVNKKLAKEYYDIDLISSPIIGKYDAIILAVAHNEFKKLSLDEITAYGKKTHVLYDLKYLLKAEEVDGRL